MMTPDTYRGSLERKGPHQKLDVRRNWYVAGVLGACYGAWADGDFAGSS